MKIWRGNEKTDDKIIALIDSIIYKANPANDEIEHYISDLRQGIIPTKKTLGIPLSYIKEIRMQEGKNYLQVFFGQDSEEHVRIHDDMQRSEVFNYFKENIPNVSFTVEHYSILKAGKQPLIALLVLIILFLWTLSYAVSIEHGNQYEVTGGHYNSIAGIVLSIASFGVTKTTIVFSVFLAIAVWSFINKAKNPPVIHRLNIKRNKA